MLTNTELKQLGAGAKLKKKSLRGNDKGSILNLDFLAGYLAVLINNNPDGLSVSIAFTKTIEADIPQKMGKNVSRSMISARLNKLWSIGYCQKKEEAIIIEGREESYRNIYYIGDPEATPVQQELHLSGKFSKRRFDGIFKDTYSFVAPMNKFEEAIFDLIADTSEIPFPITLEDYREAIVTSFKLELSREHRVLQLKQWIIEAYVDIDEAIDSDIKLIVHYANEYSKRIWESVGNQMAALQKLAETRNFLTFNQDEYERLISLNPEFYTPIYELKKRGLVPTHMSKDDRKKI